MEPHQLSIAHLIKKYSTNIITGLTAQQAAERLELYGPNELPKAPAKSWISIFFNQFLNPLIYILVAAAALIYFLDPQGTDAFIISGILFFNAIIGTLQERKTQSITQSLSTFITSECIVIRDGQKCLIEDKDVVVGDLLVLYAGQRISADARVIESNNIRVDEAILTGESMAVHKHPDMVDDEAPLAERTNMIFKGTYIVAGYGKALVVATGIATEIGKVHQSIETFPIEIPLKKDLHRLSNWILVGIFIICILLFGIGFMTGKPFHELLIMLTALFICVVPEALPVVLTLVLVHGAYRMARHYVLVKHMEAIVTLGRADVILVDKTGTLTRNELMVTKIFTDNKWWQVSGSGYHVEGVIKPENTPSGTTHNDSLHLMAVASSLLNSAEISHNRTTDLFTITGDPTEAALFVCSQKMGVLRESLETEYHKIFEIPFDASLNYHAAFYQKDGQGIALIIGSPELLIKELPAHDTAYQALKDLLQDGLRVVALAIKKFSLSTIPNQHSETFFKALVAHDLQFIGMWGIQDAIRPEVKSMVAQARNAGIKVIMVTGDHQKTASYVASQVGILTDGDKSIDGAEFTHLSDEEYARIINAVTVYSRVTPAHKLRVIKMFQRLGHVVAMTGDGINDVPALVAADLGIAMGNIGAEVAKEASDMVLLDDSFVNIMYAVEQGRHIFHALRRVVSYFLTTNMGEVFIVLFALIINLPLPITAAQILWLNLITDGFLTIAIAMEPQEQGLLNDDLMHQKLHLIDRNMMLNVMMLSIPMGLGTLWIFDQYYAADITHARTMAVVTMAMFQWFNAWNCRSEHSSILRIGLFSNRWFVITSIGVILLQAALIYTPLMQHIFKTVSLTPTDLLVVLVMTLPLLVLDELRKRLMR